MTQGLDSHLLCLLHCRQIIYCSATGKDHCASGFKVKYSYFYFLELFLSGLGIKLTQASQQSSLRSSIFQNFSNIGNICSWKFGKIHMKTTWAWGFLREIFNYSFILLSAYWSIQISISPSIFILFFLEIFPIHLDFQMS